MLYILQDGTKVFTASVDKTVKMWDLNSNQAVQVAQVIDFYIYIYHIMFILCNLPNLTTEYSNIML